MKLDLAQTIVAVSSGLAPGRRAIVRLSGPETGCILRRVLVGTLGTDSNEPIEAWLQSSHATYRKAICTIRLLADSREQGSTRQLPLGCYWWPDNRSYTGESSAELHLLGSLPLVESLVETLIFHGARPAERGEFTLRSFLAGKVDLTQAEAVLGVIEAENDSELHQALSQLGGNISTPVRELRDQLLELTAHLEAGLDFVEEDIEFISQADLLSQLHQVRNRLETVSNQLESRDARRRSISVVLVGAPNAGKSSLFNALVGRPRAIVAGIAGTTRDAVTEEVRLRGLTIELTDTAGLEELNGDSPRAAAQTVLAERLRTADAVLFCVDVSTPWDAAWVRFHHAALSRKSPTLLVGTKHDAALSELKMPTVTEPRFDLLVSTSDLYSISRLTDALSGLLERKRSEFQSGALHDTLVRCRRSIDLAHAAIARAIQTASLEAGEELVAVELRSAIEDLSSVIGEVHSDDILGQIFSRFCIGK